MSDLLYMSPCRYLTDVSRSSRFLLCGRKTTHVGLFISDANLQRHSDVIALQLYRPQPFAHDCLEELPGRDLAQDFPVAVCEDGVSVAS